ncbi:hypothetical protein CASFOL_023783 [Castilleja foliolosa]|uniref:Uncharacterized protein n=1 Tax=Castilleja foliolosa TaxID=1961234 RepID=A0ABD3CNQ6_9LAMI
MKDSSNAPPQHLLERLKDYKKTHLPSGTSFLLKNEISSSRTSRIDRIIGCSFRPQGLPTEAIEPVPENNVSTIKKWTMEERERWWKMGLKAISDGILGELRLSGGQVAKSTDGNGELYSETLKLLDDMAMRGIK